MIGRCENFVLAMGFALLAGTELQAQSAYGCTDLNGHHNIPSVEGNNGVFFRINPDLHMFHSISDESIKQIAKLSEALKATGTTLIYAPIPTRALAMPNHLPHIALDYGFQSELAATVYDDTIRRLSRAQVLTVNLRRALRISAQNALPFFATDPRLTPEGGRQMAAVLAKLISQTDGFEAAPKAQFSTTVGAPKIWPSSMRNNLQRHCMLKLPEVKASEHVTTTLQAFLGTTSNSIFGSQANSLRIALVGTDVTGSPVSNLAGALSQETGFDVVKYSVADGGSFAAISSYLTSSTFQEVRPAYLIWANPIDNNLAQFGDQPMRELTAATASRCRISLPFTRGATPQSIRAKLNGLDAAQPYTLYLDTGGANASEVRFDFTSRQGLVQSKHVIRHPDQVKTGRFYMPLSGLWREGAQTVDVSLDVPFGPNARISACFD